MPTQTFRPIQIARPKRAKSNSALTPKLTVVSDQKGVPGKSLLTDRTDMTPSVTPSQSVTPAAPVSGPAVKSPRLSRLRIPSKASSLWARAAMPAPSADSSPSGLVSSATLASLAAPAVSTAPAMGTAAAIGAAPAASVLPETPARQHGLHLTRRGRLVFIGLPIMLTAAAALTLLAFFTAPAMASSGAPEVTRTIQVSVAAGESLWELAEEFAPERDPRDVVADIMELNNLSDASIPVGIQLYIPVEG